MVAPKPVKLTQVDAASYDGAFEPEPLIVVGPIPGGGGGGGGAVDSVNGKTGDVVLSAEDVGAATAAQGAKADTAVQPAAITNFVPDTRTVAGKPLTANVTLAPGDVGAATAAQGAKADTAVQPAGLTKAAVGLGNVDNTSDASKPVSTAQATALAGKAGAGGGLTGVTVWDAVEDITSPVTGGIYFVKRA